MSHLKVAVAIMTSCLGLPILTVPGSAATAHNSQAGAYGSTTNNCAPTPYFSGGDCVSSAIEGSIDNDVLPPPARYRLRRSVQPSAE